MVMAVTIRVNVETIDPEVSNPPLRGPDGMVKSVQNAIEHAVRNGQSEGFCHGLENSISIMVDDVAIPVVLRENP